MTAIITSIDDIKAFVPVNVNLKFNSVSPYFDNVLRDKLIFPWLGTEIIEDLEDNLGSNDEVYQNLEKKTQAVIAYFSILEAMPFLEVQFGDEGIHRVESDYSKSAYQGQIKRIQSSLATSGYSAIEDLLNYLNENVDEYAVWTTAPGYTESKRYIFKNSLDFHNYYNLQLRAQTYTILVQPMRYINQFVIGKAIGTAAFKNFIDIKNEVNGVNTNAKKLEAIELLKNATAYLTVAKALRENWVALSANGIHFKMSTTETVWTENQATAEQLSQKIKELQNTGEDYLQALISLMNNNLDDFPEFNNDNTVNKPSAEDNILGGVEKTWVS